MPLPVGRRFTGQRRPRGATRGAFRPTARLRASALQMRHGLRRTGSRSPKAMAFRRAYIGRRR